ncbi:hypothetical protein CRUP_034466 [Coryphaenoides rupestris]|nr:hypothetical protein CRUP_034466 [Coryphaenoides rupestris]
MYPSLLLTTTHASADQFTCDQPNTYENTSETPGDPDPRRRQTSDRMHTTSTSGTTTITRLMALELSSSGTRTTTPSSSSTTSSSSSSSISSTSPPPLPPSSVVSVPPRVGSRSRGLSGGGARGVVSASGAGSGAFRQPMKSRRMERGERRMP